MCFVVFFEKTRNIEHRVTGIIIMPVARSSN